MPKPLRTPPGVPILMYHYIGEPPTEDNKPWYVSERRFTEQMKALRDMGFVSLTPTELIDGLENKAGLPKHSVLISFDDGDASFIESAAPVLEQNGLKATMFLITSAVGKKGYLNWAQVRELDGDMFSFESHSMYHKKITEIDASATYEEIVGSWRELAAQLDRPPVCYCYRGGLYNEQAQAMVQDAGYRAAVSCRPGYNQPSSDRFALHRWAIRETDDLESLTRKVCGPPAISLGRRIINGLRGLR